MSTSPDDVVNLLSRWLARHVSDDDLRRELVEAERVLEGGDAEAVRELLDALERGGRGEIEVCARETLEALALGA